MNTQTNNNPYQLITSFIAFVMIACIGLAFTVEAPLNETNPVDTLEYASDLGSSSMSILGTSSLHDWESNVENFNIKTSRTGDLISVNLTVHVNSIKSHSKAMDKNTYKALMLDDYPTITLKATQLTIKDNSKIVGQGNLTVAGTTKRIPLELAITSLTDQSMTVTSVIPIKMTDYGVTPPVALLGTIKTGDEIKIKFNIKLNQINNL